MSWYRDLVFNFTRQNIQHFTTQEIGNWNSLKMRNYGKPKMVGLYVGITGNEQIKIFISTRFSNIVKFKY